MPYWLKVGLVGIDEVETYPTWLGRGKHALGGGGGLSLVRLD